MEHKIQNPNENGGKESPKIIIDFEVYFHEGKEHPQHDPGAVIYYRIKVNDKIIDLKDHGLLGSSILKEAGFADDEQIELFQRIREHGQIKEKLINPDQFVDFRKLGIERFITKPKEYCFWVDKKEFYSPAAELTVRQLLENYVNVDPVDKTLAQKRDGSIHEFKNLEENIPLKDCPRFTLLDNTPTTISCFWE